MNMKKFLVSLLICTIAFTVIPKAQPITNVYKQGIYTISNKNAVTGTATATLITPDNITTLIIIDPNGALKLYKRFDSVNQSVTLDTIDYKDIVIIAGSGEIAVLNYEFSSS